MAGSATTTQRIDLWAFIAFAVAGMVVICFLKPLGFPQAGITITVCMMVVLYSVAMYRYERLHLRLDQAADNSYYLGLVYTLTSMGRALYSIGQQVDPHDGHIVFAVEPVIGDFGVALSSTLIGILCRLTLQQMRVDPADVERATRLELADAASRMRAQISLITSGLGEFHATMAQKHQDYVHEMQEMYKGLAESVAAQFAQAAETSLGHVQRAEQTSHKATLMAAQNVEAAAQSLGAAVERSARTLDEAIQALVAIERPPVALARAFDRMAVRVEHAGDQIKGAGDGISERIAHLQQISDLLSKASAAMLHTVTRTAERETLRDGQSLASIERQAKQLDALDAVVSKLQSHASVMSQSALDSAESVRIVEESARQALNGLTNAISTLGSTIDGGVK